MKHIWACTCGNETECQPDDLQLGSVWKCTGCRQSWGAVYRKGGPKVWIKISKEDVKFHDLFAENRDNDCWFRIGIFRVDFILRNLECNKSRAAMSEAIFSVSLLLWSFVYRCSTRNLSLGECFVAGTEVLCGKNKSPRRWAESGFYGIKPSKSSWSLQMSPNA